MKSKTIVTICIIVTCVVFTFSSCKKESEKDEYGQIKDVVITSENVTTDGEKLENEFNATKTDMEYKWETVNVGRAMIKIPYPSGWDVRKETDYKIAFEAPMNDKYFPGVTIFFHSTLEGENITDSSNIIKRFQSELMSDKYTIAGQTYLVDGTSEIDNIVVDDKIIDADRQMQKTYRDYNCSARENGTRSPDYPLYREMNCFYWHTFPCMFTGVIYEEYADKLDELFNYMLTHATFIDDTIGDTAQITIFPNTSCLEVPMTPLYEKYAISPGDLFDDGVGFMCPVNSGTGYSQSYLLIYEVEKDRFKMNTDNFEKKGYLDTILLSSIGYSKEMLDANGYMSSDSGEIPFNGKNTKEYIYQFDVGRTLPEEGLYKSQAWEINMYPIDTGEHINLVCLVAPYDGQAWAFDLIKHMALKLKY